MGVGPDGSGGPADGRSGIAGGLGIGGAPSTSSGSGGGSAGEGGSIGSRGTSSPSRGTMGNTIGADSRSGMGGMSGMGGGRVSSGSEGGSAGEGGRIGNGGVSGSGSASRGGALGEGRGMGGMQGMGGSRGIGGPSSGSDGGSAGEGGMFGARGVTSGFSPGSMVGWARDAIANATKAISIGDMAAKAAQLGQAAAPIGGFVTVNPDYKDVLSTQDAAFVDGLLGKYNTTPSSTTAMPGSVNLTAPTGFESGKLSVFGQNPGLFSNTAVAPTFSAEENARIRDITSKYAEAKAKATAVANSRVESVADSGMVSIGATFGNAATATATANANAHLGGPADANAGMAGGMASLADHNTRTANSPANGRMGMAGGMAALADHNRDVEAKKAADNNAGMATSIGAIAKAREAQAVADMATAMRDTMPGYTNDINAVQDSYDKGQATVTTRPDGSVVVSGPLGSMITKPDGSMFVSVETRTPPLPERPDAFSEKDVVSVSIVDAPKDKTATQGMLSDLADKNKQHDTTITGKQGVQSVAGVAGKAAAAATGAKAASASQQGRAVSDISGRVADAVAAARTAEATKGAPTSSASSSAKAASAAVDAAESAREPSVAATSLPGGTMTDAPSASGAATAVPDTVDVDASASGSWESGARGRGESASAGGEPAPDFRGQKAPASIRFNNPGAQYPGPISKKWGSVGTETIGGKHLIAVFPDALAGAAATFDLLDQKYTGKTLKSALTTWSGGLNVKSYLSVVGSQTGLKPSSVLTSEMMQDPAVAIPIAKAMAQQEAGKGYPMSDAQWAQAHDMFTGKTTATASGEPTGSEMSARIAKAMESEGPTLYDKEGNAYYHDAEGNLVDASGKVVQSAKTSSTKEAEPVDDKAGSKTFSGAPTGTKAAKAGGWRTPSNQARAMGLKSGSKANLTDIKATKSGATFTVAEEVAPQFKALIDALEGAGYSIDPGTSGGYVDRSKNVGGKKNSKAGKSQHAYGNAVDINWSDNAAGSTTNNLPADIGAIAAKFGITWGGQWDGETVDPMHFEANQVMSAEALAEAVGTTQTASSSQSGGGSAGEGATAMALPERSPRTEADARIAQGLKDAPDSSIAPTNEAATGFAKSIRNAIAKATADPVGTALGGMTTGGTGKASTADAGIGPTGAVPAPERNTANDVSAEQAAAADSSTGRHELDAKARTKEAYDAKVAEIAAKVAEIRADIEAHVTGMPKSDREVAMSEAERKDQERASNALSGAIADAQAPAGAVPSLSLGKVQRGEADTTVAGFEAGKTAPTSTAETDVAFAERDKAPFSLDAALGKPGVLNGKIATATNTKAAGSAAVGLVARATKTAAERQGLIAADVDSQGDLAAASGLRGLSTAKSAQAVASATVAGVKSVGQKSAKAAQALADAQAKLDAATKGLPATTRNVLASRVAQVAQGQVGTYSPDKEGTAQAIADATSSFEQGQHYSDPDQVASSEISTPAGLTNAPRDPVSGLPVSGMPSDQAIAESQKTVEISTETQAKVTKIAETARKQIADTSRKVATLAISEQDKARVFSAAVAQITDVASRGIDVLMRREEQKKRQEEAAKAKAEADKKSKGKAKKPAVDPWMQALAQYMAALQQAA